MPTYRVSDGSFVPLVPTRITDLEHQLESDLQNNAHVLLAPERILYVGRQVTTDLNKAIDLLGIDALRRAVVVELKKDRTPRDIVAQALEYAAFVDKLDLDALNAIAVRYFGQYGKPWKSLEEAHRDFFEGVVSPDSEAVWNSSAIVILEGQVIAPEIVEVAAFLRAHNIDIRVMQFAYMESAEGDRLVDVQTVVGAERLPEEATAASSATQQPSLDETLERSPDLRCTFTLLHEQLLGLGLSERRSRTTISFSRPETSRVCASVWPAVREPRIYFQVNWSEDDSSRIDILESDARALGFTTTRGVRGHDLSVYVRSADESQVPALVAAFSRLVTAQTQMDDGARA